MAKLPEYSDTERNVVPSDVGFETALRAGRQVAAGYKEEGRDIGGAISQVGGQLGREADQYYTQREVSDVGAKSLQLFQDATTQYQAARKAADPNDPDFTAKFMDAFKQSPAIQGFAGQYHTKEGQAAATRSIDGLQQHMFTTAHAEDAEFAHAAAMDNFTKMGNAGASAVAQDPSSFAAVSKMISYNTDAYIASHPNLSAVEGNSLRTVIKDKLIDQAAMSGFKSVALNHNLKDRVAAATAYANQPGMAEHLDKQVVVATLDQAFHTDKAEAATANMLAHQAKTDAHERNFDAIIREGAVRDTNGKVTDFRVSPHMLQMAEDAMAKGNLPPGQAMEIVHMANAQADRAASGKMAAHDPTVVDNLEKGITLPDGDPSKTTLRTLVAAHTRGDVNDNDFSRMSGDIKTYAEDPQAGADRTAVDKHIAENKSLYTKSGMLGVTSQPEDDLAFSTFANNLRQGIEQWRKAHPHDDIHSLFDTNNPNNPVKNAPPDRLKEQAKRQLIAWSAAQTGDHLDTRTPMPTGGQGGTTGEVTPVRGRRAGESTEHFNQFLKTGRE